jgi:hypothetical protein
MLKFTKEQSALLVNERRAYDKSHERMATNHAGFLLGNASTLSRSIPPHWAAQDRHDVPAERPEGQS